MPELPWRSDRLGVGATPAKVAVSYTVIAIVWLTMLDFGTVGFIMRTNQQRSCSHWARQRERPWIEGAFPCSIRNRMSCATPSPKRLRREKEEAEYALEGSNSETFYCVCEGSTYNFCSLSKFRFLNLSCSLNDISSFGFDPWQTWSRWIVQARELSHTHFFAQLLTLVMHGIVQTLFLVAYGSKASVV